MLTLTEIGLPVLEFSTRISLIYALTNSELKFHESGIKNRILIGFNLVSPLWEPAVITTTLCSTANGESLKVLYAYP